MKKKLIAMLCIAACILGLCACGTDQTKKDYNGYSYDELKEYAESVWSTLQSADLSQIEPVIEQIDAMSDAQRISTMDANDGLEEQYNLYKSWISVSEQAGNYIDEGSFTVTKSGKTTTAELILNFDKRNVILSVVYKNHDMSVEATTVDVVYTTGEKMTKAALNTVLGMGTVFVMLIVIYLVISLFRFMPALEAKFAKSGDKDTKKKETARPAAVPAGTTAAVRNQTSDTQLVAVIAAAIAASTGQSTDDFVVRSIKRRTNY